MDVPEHEPQPSPAEDGLMCRRCNTKLRRWLDTILDDTATLDTRIPADYSWDKESTHHKITGSPALVRLDVAALTDPRSAFSVRAEAAGYSENRNHADDSPPISIPTEIIMWAQMFADEHNIQTPTNTMAAAVNLLTTWWDTLLWCPWIDEFHTRMAEIRRQLDTAHGVERRKSVGKCLTVTTSEDGRTATECGHRLYQDQSSVGVAVARCSGCGRVYRGLDLVRAQHPEGKMTG